MKSSDEESLELNATKALNAWELTWQGLCGSKHKALLMLKLQKEVNLAGIQWQRIQKASLGTYLRVFIERHDQSGTYT